MKFVNGVLQVPEEARKMIREACKLPIVYTRDAPKLTKKQLAQFKPRSAERLAELGITPTRRIQDTQEPSKTTETPKKRSHR